LAIANGTQSGTIAPDQGAVVQSDLATLATVLHLSAASTPPPTTTSTTTIPPGPGNGFGNGNGH
jgi:hypothetical protein